MKKHMRILVTFFLIIDFCGLHAQSYILPEQNDRWSIQPDGSIEWKMDGRIPHSDHIEMSGEIFIYLILFHGKHYTQLHIQFVFAVRYRAAHIQKEWKEKLHQYLTGIFQENDHKMLQLNSMSDSIHILIGMHPAQSISSLVQNVKIESCKRIKDKKFCAAPFAWQEGYGAFSYSKSQVPDVIRYIQNQDAHHKQVTFLDEYRHFLNTFEIDYDEQYIVKEPE